MNPLLFILSVRLQGLWKIQLCASVSPWGWLDCHVYDDILCGASTEDFSSGLGRSVSVFLSTCQGLSDQWPVSSLPSSCPGYLLGTGTRTGDKRLLLYDPGFSLPMGPTETWTRLLLRSVFTPQGWNLRAGTETLSEGPVTWSWDGSFVSRKCTYIGMQELAPNM